MRLMTVPGVFRPRSDSLMLARQVSARVRPGDRVLDPFTGSGLLAVAAARAGATVTAVDVSRRAVACTRANARLNGVRVRALCGDMLAPVGRQRFDLIVANPPYVPSIAEWRPRGAARAWEAGVDGRALLDRLCREAPANLSERGSLLIVHSSLCAPEVTRAMLAEAGLEVEVLERRRGPLGPLLAERADLLERRGQLRPGEREEELVVVRAGPPGSGSPALTPGRESACAPA